MLFGDGNWATGKVVNHTYSGPGEYTVKLVVTDDSGLTDSADGANRLLSETKKKTGKKEKIYYSFEYEYDAVGNRLSLKKTYNKPLFWFNYRQELSEKIRGCLMKGGWDEDDEDDDSDDKKGRKNKNRGKKPFITLRVGDHIS